jgi:alpha-D-ribose 1-methylphosphonate 5-triphosphate diphosphatase
MLDTPQTVVGAPVQWDGALQLTNAQLVLPNDVRHGSITIDAGKIADLDTEGARTQVLDLEGDYLIPGVIDLHTDHVETHVHPRSTVQWAFLPALLAHDAVVIAGGTTTVFDSLCVGATMKRPERGEILLPLIEALEHGQTAGAFRADHLLHLRCEISDPDTPQLTADALQHPLARLVSVMDHTPGDRQSPDIERWFNHMIHEMEITASEGRARMDELFKRSERIGAQNRAKIIAHAKAANVPVMSHDDRSVAHVDQALAEGVTISEFPTTHVAAKRAKDHALGTVMGAPNYLRGGSQSGNVAVKELLEAGLVDALASDYVPRSPLDCAFAIAADRDLDIDLPSAIALVSSTPARFAGLTDRGRLETGLRADLVQVRVMDGQPVVRGVWREGIRVF